MSDPEPLRVQILPATGPALDAVVPAWDGGGYDVGTLTATTARAGGHRGPAGAGRRCGCPPRPAMIASDDRKRAASRNTAALLASRITIASLGWAGSIVIARLLSPTQFGAYSFVFGLLALLSIVTDLGGSAAWCWPARGRGGSRHPPVASSFIALRVVLGLIGYLVALSYVLLLAIRVRSSAPRPGPAWSSWSPLPARR